MTKLLGIDAGFQAMGTVIVELGDMGDGDTAFRQILFAETCRTKRTAKKRGIRVADDDAERCQKLARFLLDIICTHNPAGAVVELPSGGAKGARSNRAMGMATGVVVSVLEMTKLPAEWVTPQMVKRAATGRNDGSKSEVQKAVKALFNWDYESRNNWPRYKWAQEHVADAAAAVLSAEDGMLVRALMQARTTEVSETGETVKSA